VNLYSSSLFALIILVSALPICASKNDTDDQIWVAAVVSHEFSPVFAVEIEQQLRYKDQYSTLDKSISQLTLSIDATKKFNLALGYRYTNSPDEINRRVQLAGSTSIKINRWRFNYRQQYQAEFESGIDAKYEVRNKFGVRYPLWARIVPYVEYEWFHSIDDPAFEYRKYRATTGFRINLRGQQVLKLFLRLQQQVNRKTPDRQNILGLKYEYDF